MLYDSLQVSVVKRYSRGLRAQVSYNLASNIDEASGINSQAGGRQIQLGVKYLF
jgi:hypothetical protein